MQLLDPQDPRRPNEQIAASIRAAILTGELEPGQKLPPGTELAEYFGVTRTTVANAIRKLADEGFVRTRAGASVYVRDQADLPGPDDGPHPLAGLATFTYEMGHLKRLTRAGWLLLGVPSPESVAEHSFRVSMVAMLLAALDGADVGRTVALAAFHDGHETRISDVPSVGRAYVSTARPETVTEHQTAGMPDKVALVVRELTAEYEANQTREANLAHDADKLETLAQAIEYQAQGHDAQAWRETSVAALRTEPGRQLAQAFSSTSPQWWQPFAASYHELRASTRGHDTKKPAGN
jgi:putative hydrolase of HD superfamily